MAAVTYLVEEVWERDWLPWGYDFFWDFLIGPAMLLWGTLLIVFLINPTFRHPNRQGRRQAGLVLLGGVGIGSLVIGVLIYLNANKDDEKNSYGSIIDLQTFL